MSIQFVSSEAELNVVKKRLAEIEREAKVIFDSSKLGSYKLVELRQISRDYALASQNIVFGQFFSPEVRLDTKAHRYVIDSLLKSVYRKCEASNDWPEIDQQK